MTALAEMAGWPRKLFGSFAFRLSALMAGIFALTLILTAAPTRIGELISGNDSAQASTGNLAANLRADLPDELLDIVEGKEDAELAEGEEAERINASLPFSTVPLEAATPFQLGALGTPSADRAELCMTQAVYYEAAFEPLEGRRAVAQVVLNRVRHPAYPNSVCGVVYQGVTRPVCQFSFTCDGSLNRRPGAAAWAAAERVAREALNGEVASAVGMATHYHADYVAPYWAPRLTKLRQIGRHIFYRFPGTWGRRGAFVDRYSGREAIPSRRVIMRDEDGEIDEIATAVASLPPDPTDRHAPEDIGGRLNTETGWTLSIPNPDETTGGLREVMSSQRIDQAERNRGVATAGGSGD